MRKTSISQRWEPDFAEKTKEYARKAGVSITQFTIDALDLLGHLLEIPGFIELTSTQRKELIMSSIIKPEINKSELGSIQTKLEQVENYLIDHAGEEFSTIELSDILKIKQSTVRTYVQKLGTQSNFVVIEGRPNKIKYSIPR
ncbi:MAG: hypothetical protein INQ03_12225 [Candidatus Heimdallarchaeota archaeon]|nr:hypothetical protein [Candidatus Heimdallarchaeota archaeon]